jgi:hypothetical protein
MSTITFQARIAQARTTPITDVVAQRGIKLRRNGVERVGPCPACGGTDRFSINPQKGVFHCRRCTVGGDVIALTRFLDNCDFKTAIATLGGNDVPSPAPRSPIPKPKLPKPASDAAWAPIWRESVDPTGTLVEVYLRSRGLSLPDGVAGHVIRFHGSLRYDGERRPGMVCLFRDIHTDEPCGIHRTFLDADGTKIDRRMYGQAAGAAIKLDADENVMQGLHIGEGVETCIAAMLAGYRPTWALGSAGGIAKFPLLAGVDAISILTERNDNGANERAVDELNERWAERDVFVIEPLIGDDINDAWRADHA